MVDGGLAQMLQVLQSPMGAALIPTMWDREKLVQDRSKADLASVVARTAIEQQRDQRDQQMHPLAMEARRTATEGQALANEGTQFDLGVKQRLGPEFYEQNARTKASSDELEKLSKASRNFATIAAQLQRPEGTVEAPGAVRQRAVDLARQYQLPHLIPQIEQFPDEAQIPKLFDTMARAVSTYSTQYVSAERAAEGRLRTTELTNRSREEVARIQAQARQVAAKIRQAAAASSGSSKRWLEEMAFRYTAAMDKGDMVEAENILEMVKEYQTSRASKPVKPQSPPTAKQTDTIMLPSGGVRTTTQNVPIAPAPSGATTGWGEPTRIDGKK